MFCVCASGCWLVPFSSTFVPRNVLLSSVFRIHGMFIKNPSLVSGWLIVSSVCLEA